MEHLSKYVWIDIIEYVNFNHRRVIRFKNYALVNKKTFLIAKEYLSYKKRQFKLYNTPKTHKNCLYRLKVTNIKRYHGVSMIEQGLDCGDVAFLPLLKKGASFEFIILITKIYPSFKGEFFRINYIVLNSVQIYPGAAMVNELLDENFICFY